MGKFQRKLRRERERQMAQVEAHVLRFVGGDERSEKRFEVCYYANQNGGKTAGRRHRKRVLRIRDKLEAIGVERVVPVRDQTGKETEVERWELALHGGDVTLDADEFEELRDRIDTYGDTLHTAAHRDLEDALVWVESAKKERFEVHGPPVVAREPDAIPESSEE